MLLPENINLQQYSETLEACIKSQGGLHATTYHNICDGTTNIVPYGIVEYLLFAGGVLFLGFILGFVIWMIKELILGY